MLRSTAITDVLLCRAAHIVLLQLIQNSASGSNTYYTIKVVKP